MKKELLEKLRVEKENPSVIICSTDKDLNNTPGWHYNFKEGRKYWIDEDQAIKNFYLQLLTGDKTDNIIGIPGIGPVKAEQILEGATTEKEMYEKVGRCYEDYMLSVWAQDNDGTDSFYEFINVKTMECMMENAQLLWIRREKEQQWQPPTERH